MSPIINAIIEFGHVLGAAFLIGGAAMLVLGGVEGSGRPRFVILLGILLSLVTGLAKWLGPGGVGPLGNGGAHTTLLHGKIAIGLLVFHLLLSGCKHGADGKPRRNRLRGGLLLALLVALFAAMHRYRVFA